MPTIKKSTSTVDGLIVYIFKNLLFNLFGVKINQKESKLSTSPIGNTDD
jgi:hypothetical protein